MAGIDLSGASNGAADVAVDLGVLTGTPLTATLPGSTVVSAGLFVSSFGSNTPTPDVGNITAYVDPSAPTQGSATPGADLGLPNHGVQRQPFLRGILTFTSMSVGYDGNRNIGWTYPGDAQVGDAVVIALQGLASNVTPPKGWAELNNTSGVRVWAHYLEDGEAGTQINSFVTGYSSMLAVGGIWGNAQVDAVLGNTAYTANSATAPQITASPGDAVAFIWMPYKSYSSPYQISWTAPGYVQHLKDSATNYNYYYWPAIGDAYPTTDTYYAPALTATTSGVSLGHSINFSIRLRGLIVFPYAEVALEEAVGPAQDTQDVESFLHLMALDEHSPQDQYGYAQGAMNDTGSGVLYTYERWVRVRFTPQFNTVKDFRAWAPNLVDIPEGWTIKFGTASSFQTPVNTASSIATIPMPTSDPGAASPNAGGESPLAGTGTQYSDWIVLQASADTAVVGPGPVLGFSTEGTLIPIQFAFTWIET